MAKFEVQARVLDLLGIEQIANCPTAISELFKNAWDAYADRAILDVYSESGHVILWDDGIGMTEEQLLHRWLVVGAAGKEDLPTSIEPPEGVACRPIQGEKGIGRLAISTLGDTLLLISRSQSPTDPSQPYVALLINWNIVRNEFLRLSDLEIPYLTFASVDDLATGIIRDMALDLRAALLSEPQAYAWEGVDDSEKRAEALTLRQSILDQLADFSVDMPRLKRTIGEWKHAHGTLFWISNLKDEFGLHLQRPLRDEGDEDPYTKFVQLLSNFRNTFSCDDPDLEQDTAFETDVRRWDSQRNLLSSMFRETAAFEPSDLRFYDHRLDVEFDETGRFAGTLEVYGSPAPLPSLDAQRKLGLRCGPFRLRLWYYQDKNESRLDSEQWSLISKKLERFGGLMIYRDGLRVLPYGLLEYDWLHMEERRSRGLAYYFFSYRRLFGYVDITRHQNPELVDKAGREGLITNNAYRDFRQTLETFFIYLARQFFGRDTSFPAAKKQISAERRRVEQERKRAAEQRAALLEQAAQKLDFALEKAPEQLELAFRDAAARLGDPTGLDPSSAADELVRFENRVSQILGTARLVVPKKLSISRHKELRRLVYDHNKAFAGLALRCEEVRHRFQDHLKENFPAAEYGASRKRATDQAYAQALARIGKAYKETRAEFEKQTQALDAGLEEIYTRLRARAEEIIRSSISTQIDRASTSQAVEKELLGALSQIAESAVEELNGHEERLRNYLSTYFGESQEELVAAQTSEIDQLKEEVDRNLELVQLGLAVEIIDHDLGKLFLGIRTTLARLQNLLRNASGATKYLADLRSSFHHLEQRFRQMSPLYRGSYRTKTRIDGRRILSYCREFLSHQLRTVGAELEATEAFLGLNIEEVEAVVFPVFINIIDNAVFWLRESPEKRVLLDRHGPVVTVCDTGPGIHATMFDDIFEPFVSNKPGGRGLGLYIARANLQRYGHEVWATDDPEYRILAGACVCIRFHEDVIMGNLHG